MYRSTTGRRSVARMLGMMLTIVLYVAVLIVAAQVTVTTTS